MQNRCMSNSRTPRYNISPEPRQASSSTFPNSAPAWAHSPVSIKVRTMRINRHTVESHCLQQPLPRILGPQPRSSPRVPVPDNLTYTSANLAGARRERMPNPVILICTSCTLINHAALCQGNVNFETCVIGWKGYSDEYQGIFAPIITEHGMR
jgi:hypothetical protein